MSNGRKRKAEPGRGDISFAKRLIRQFESKTGLGRDRDYIPDPQIDALAQTGVDVSVLLAVVREHDLLSGYYDRVKRLGRLVR